MKSFQISRLQAGLVQSAFYFGYFCVSMPAAFVLRRFGYRTGLVSGLLLYALGCLLFWPAAEINRYSFFLLALFVIAAGLAFLETGAASFIAQLGEPETSERRLNFAQSFNPPGTIAGALIGTVFIFSGIEPTSEQVRSMKDAGSYNSFLHQETLRVITPYLVLSAVGVPVRDRSVAGSLSAGTQRGCAPEQRCDWKSAACAAFFVGCDCAVFLCGCPSGHMEFSDSVCRGLHAPTGENRGYFLSGTLVLFALGRFVSTFLMQYIRPNVLMGVLALANVALLAVAMAGRLDGTLGSDVDQLLHVSDVPDDICAGSEAPWGQHDAGSFGAGDGDHWRSGDGAIAGVGGRACAEHGRCFRGPARVLPGGGVLLLYRLEDSRVRV